MTLMTYNYLLIGVVSGAVGGTSQPVGKLAIEVAHVLAHVGVLTCVEGRSFSDTFMQTWPLWAVMPS